MIKMYHNFGSLCIILLISLISSANCDCGCCENCTTTSSSSVSCEEGFHFDNTTNSCEICPLGHYCPTSCAVALPCTAGFYSNSTGQLACTSCPSGYHCSDMASFSDPQPCLSGFYSNEGSSFCSKCNEGFYANQTNMKECLQCPAGSQCSNSSEGPQPCPAGSYSLAGSSVCQPCPSGYYSNNSASEDCQPCPAGYNCVPSASPVACTIGHYSMQLQMNCHVCPSGFYSNMTSSASCLLCPAGYQCSNASNPQPCSVGAYATQGSVSCTKCPDGYYTNSTGQSECQECPAGYQCKNEVSQICPAGFMSLPRATNCTACLSGLTYSSRAGSSECIRCPEGYECEDPGKEPSNKTCSAGYYATSGDRCMSCPPGTFSNDTGAIKCSPCPAGFYCPAAPSTEFYECWPGTFSILGSTNCTQCPTGYFQTKPGMDSCDQCPSGYLCSNPAEAPVECSSGYYSTHGQVVCEACTGGTYQNKSGQNNCTQCPAGRHCPGPATTSPILCTAGYFSAAGAESCTACVFGTYAVDSGATECQLCPMGHKCPKPSSLPEPCPMGEYSFIEGSSSCFPCPPGTYTNGNRSSVCSNCSVGYECRSGIGQEKCWPGTYSDVVGSNKCKACEQGTYNTNWTSDRCFPCPAGYSCMSSNVQPEECPVGTYSAVGSTFCQGCSAGEYARSSGSSMCAVCPKDFYCTNSTKDPVPCDIGTYSPPGSTKCLVSATGTYYDSATGNILACSAGTYYNSSKCSDCPKGFYCAGFKALPEPCVNGTYQDQTGRSSCRACPQGQSCLDPSAPPIDCVAGQFSPQGSETCEPCPVGSFSSATSSVCTSCPAGSSCLGQSMVENCDAGTISGLGDGSCSSCTSGTHTDGLTGQSYCRQCPAGYQCQNATIAPVGCLPGQYSFLGDAECWSCPSGMFCPDTRTISPCPLGTYSLGGANSGCDDCPSGQSCLNASQPPISCGVGRYSLLGDVACRECPAGSSCADASSNPVSCAVGEFSAAGNGSCYPCPIGYACEVSYLSPRKCPIGTTTHGLGKQTVCSECPDGFLCNDSATFAATCPSGAYVPPGSLDCVPCPAGVSCSGSTATPCNGGSFSVEGQSNCTTCDAGYACPYTHTAAKIACQSGTYSVGGQTTCTVCPAAKSCASTTSASATDCGEGFYSFGGQDQCTPCPAGQKCPEKDGSKNANCAEGTFSTGKSIDCKKCTAGKACPSTTSDTEIPCEPGTYSAEGSSSCTRCPAGYECPNTNTADGGAAACALGTYSSGGQGVCSDCPAGFKCPMPFSATIISCPPGTYSEGSQHICLDCPAGEECPVNTSPGTACDLGKYSTGRQTSCILCPAGYDCPDRSKAPVACSAGQFSTGGTSDCKDCDAGYICNKASTSKDPASGLCPLGYFCPAGATTPSPCEAGTYGAKLGLAAQSDCTDCPEGYFCLETTGGTPGADNLCPRGAFCPAKTKSPNENPCPSGTYGPNVGQISESAACKTCPEGRSCQEGSGDPGVACPRGHYCTTGSGGLPDSNPPTACDAGTYTAEEGARTIDACVSCPAGYYCTEGTANPSACPAGTYQADERQPSDKSCHPCKAGMACTSPALTAPDKSCDPGHYCPEGSDVSNKEPCPSGTYTDFFNLTAAQQCTTCPVRFACYNGTGGTNKHPEVCAPGYYCPNGTQYPTQYPCPAGSYSNKTNLAYLDECWECPKGFYCVNGSTSPQGPCPTGYYCPPGTEFDKQHPCSAGAYSNKTGNVRPEDCDACIAGHYCGEGASDPTPCPEGTFNTDAGSPNQLSCSKCTAGYYCPDNGTEEPLPCGVGFYSDYGAASCSVCDAGYYCDDISTTNSERENNKTCPPGTHCPPGTVQAPNLYNSSCPAGYYCLRGNVNAYPVPCPVGSFSDETGLTSLAGCEDCTEGYYCDVTNLTKPAGLCPPGHFCPKGTGASDSNPCVAGTYLNNTAAVSVDSCVLCTSGSYCETNGTSAPIPCPEGNYCEPGTSIPVPCPTGTFGNRTGIKSSLECAPCLGGWYCAGDGNIEPTAKCDAGYYCVAGADNPTPNGGSKGDVCFSGGYCPEGSSYPNACPAGKYSPYEKATSVENCTDCPAGQFCSGSSASGITGNCTAGYYCTGGASEPTQHSSQPGYYSEEGAPDQTLCPCGTYSPGYHATSCSDCPAGQYCPDDGMNATLQCPEGHYCGLNKKNPDPCPAGTWNDEPGQVDLSACNLCLAGYYCPESGQINSTLYKCVAGHWCGSNSTIGTPDETSSTGGLCEPGHYCPAGTKSADENQCDFGTYNNVTAATNETFCKPCPGGLVCSKKGLSSPDALCAAGYYCIEGATDSTPTNVAWGFPCTAGHYCPEGTAQPWPCPAGNYTLVELQSSCAECEAGFYCTGETHRDECQEGFYCPAGTGFDLQPCPFGTYGNIPRAADESACKHCDQGYYCDEYNLTKPHKPCDEGYYCRFGVNVSDPSTSPYSGNGGRCPPGHFCPKQTGEPVPCPSGTFLNESGAASSSKCNPCPPGQVCSVPGLEAPDEECAAGFYCIGGANVTEPTDGGTGIRCPVGKHCPAGTPVPLDCSPGSYSLEEGLANCTLCESGFYCPNGTTDYTMFPCKPGYYCPAGTADYLEHPCPPGKFNNFEKAQSEDDCLQCFPGEYCLGDGSNTTSGLCDPGFYCLTGSPTPRPSGYSNFTTDDCRCPANDTGGICPKGYFCPRGADRPKPCTGGFYCPDTGLNASFAQCDAGYYCSSAATRPDPSDNVTGGVCPPGYWCDKGTDEPNACPSGTYGNGSGVTSLSLCTPCPPGYYCPDPAQQDYHDVCPAGFYCPAKSSADTNHPCEAGYQCPSGSADHVLCEGGHYQDESVQVTCKVCPAGYYCDRAFGPITNYTNYPCPEGSYCPENTSFATQHLCPAGKYGSKTKLESAGECDECPAGRYCPTEGINSTTIDNYLCDAGSYCVSGANRSSPDDGVTGRPCSKGKYCPQGTTTEHLCNVGTFNNETGQSSAADCSTCTPGYYCASQGLEEPSGPCSARYYCPGGDVIAASADQNCTAGHYCPLGTPNPIPCPDGKYNTDRMKDECDDCPAGSYCTDGLTLQDCPSGFYCPNGTGEDWSSCPLGTYGSGTRLESASDCTPCDPGKYCDKMNATTFTAPCQEGFFCESGSSSATPDGSDGVNGRCSSGHYCPAGVDKEEDCPPGTYYNGTGATNSSFCDSCPPSYYCEGGGLAEPSGLCWGGYYCVGGAQHAANPNIDSTGGPCPTGFQCPNGTSSPLSCEAGTYNDQAGLQKCFDCRAGYYCPENSTKYEDKECPRGYYCPANTGGMHDHPCPPGTFGNSSGAQSLRDCLPCSPGMFCNSSGLLAPSGSCQGGWFCSSCAYSPTPSDLPNPNVTSCLCPSRSEINSTGGRCPPGYYCPIGSSEPRACEPGDFCATPELENRTGICQAGYYCSGGAARDRPDDGVTGDKCPVGTYCEAGSANPFDCPPGTFSNATGNEDESDCTICAAGYYCTGGEGDLSGPCAEGYYCPEGQNVSTPAAFKCPPGSMCSVGLGEPSPCPNGQYQPAGGKATCIECPDGYYCEAINSSGVIKGVEVPSDCLAGYFCPNGTEYAKQYGCPVGTYVNETNRYDESQCLYCDGGSFCDVDGLPFPAGLCSAGFFCTEGATSKEPVKSASGGPCPVGHYCPEGTTTPFNCPNGTYGPNEGITSADNCTTCDAGFYCNVPGLNSTAGQCTAGYFCPAGSTSDKAERCPIGYHCPTGSGEPQPCPIGSYTSTELQPNCTSCAAGSYCNGTIIQDCPEGYYCPLSTSTPIPCPRGTYSNDIGLHSSSDCKKCDPGFYCNALNATSTTGQCYAGFYCRNASIDPNPPFLNPCDGCDAGPCPTGYYCGNGTGEPNPCLPGTFNSAEMATGPEFCSNCTAGSFCNSSHLSEPTGYCSEGYYCSGGATSPSPVQTTETGGPCPIGDYCPVNSTRAIECPGGSYAPNEAMPSCLDCEAGYYCPIGAENRTVCPAGSYCPINSPAPAECSKGTFNNETGSPSEDYCKLCTPGYYCPREGMHQPTQLCDAGWYCKLGSWLPKPTVTGLNVSNICACPAEGDTGGQCQPGFYCPEGSSNPVPCDPGYYCDSPGLPNVTGPCAPGHYCSGQSSMLDPVGKEFGDICPAGYYCPLNSSTPTPCPSGYFTSFTSRESFDDCELCTAGMYCAASGLPSPNGTCQVGYYCPSGSTEKAPPKNKCPNGTKCPTGSSSFIPCPSGTYQADQGMGVCLTCPPGKYCDSLEAKAMGYEGVVTPEPCPPGFYCPEGTNHSTEYPCPPGKYLPSSGKERESDCIDCDAGFYCDRTNQSSPTDACSPGHFCPAQSTNGTANICPAGSFCPSGSETPLPCPNGTYGDRPGLSDTDQCKWCDPGQYCETGRDSPSGSCFAGYYCAIHSSIPNPVGQVFGDECPPGSYCPINSSQPIKCAEGTFNPKPRGGSPSDCQNCTPGYYCNGTGLTDVTGQCWEEYYCDGGASTPTQHDCLPGHSCSAGSSSPSPCLNGTYSNASNAAQCEPCPAGWYCYDGEINPQPCPPGHYCLPKTGLEWMKCPPGTFNPTDGLSSKEECTQCTPGFYCETPGLPNVTGSCDPGFNCMIGVDKSSPDNVTNLGSGGPCQPGQQCPTGFAQPCPLGTFTRDSKTPNCHECTEGFYCDGGTIDPQPCNAGYYCPKGTKDADLFPCPAGTFNNRTTQPSVASCESCTPGMYCEGTGNTKATGPCQAGYYCTSGSPSKTPVPGAWSNTTCNVTVGGKCGPGFFCPAQSASPQRCSLGQYCPDFEKGTPAGNCSAGFFCDRESTRINQTDCPPGHYCESGVLSPTPCPPGTYSSSTNNENLASCLSCKPGYYCEGYNNTAPTAQCSDGYYCPGGDASPSSPEFMCQVGHKCPMGSENQTVCPAGTYQPNEARPDCIPCDQGFICEPYDGDLSPEECPPGFYCPEGTEAPVPCPLGTYRNDPNRLPVDNSSCIDCPPGKYCGTEGANTTTGDCLPGYFCTGGATRSDPYMEKVDPNVPLSGNTICPPGYYCDGHSPPEPCPAGRYNPSNGSSDISACLFCPAGRYCETEALSDPSLAPLCSPRFYCKNGSVTATPNDDTGYPCPAGSYCTAGTPFPEACDPGTYSLSSSSSCSDCPPGSMCPGSGTSNPEDCLAGHYCPVNTSAPQPCPTSTFNPDTGRDSISFCRNCTAGFFCNGSGNASPSGECNAGYLCRGGSASATPEYDGYNGPCPAGKYCLEGTPAGTDCPRGTLRNVTGAKSEADCGPCTPGYYCAVPGLSKPTAECSCGFYCPGNDSNYSPNQYSCPVGNFCPDGASSPRPCLTGSYQPSPEQCSCDDCRPGYYCQDSLSGGETLCPPYSFCPQGTPYPISCPNGTYTSVDEVGLQQEEDCHPCPPGQFCTAGKIQGDCNEGYFCASRAYTPTGNTTNLIPCPEMETCVNLCPAGYFCPQGTVDPQPCPDNTLRSFPGASALNDCQFCPAGDWCHRGNPVPDLCPLGYFCPGLNSSDCAADAGPQPCPANTYRDVPGARSDADCPPCPPGYWCNDTGLSNYNGSACALGYYCLGGGQSPAKCPAGTLRNETGATNVTDCSPCTPGFYCPDPTTTGVTNINGIPCEKGYTCSGGSVDQLPCPAGYYCLERNSIPELCPAGYFCEKGSYAYEVCTYPFYCPNGTGDPLPCDIGYQPLNISGLRSDLTVACMICPVGYYRNSSADDACRACPPGYFCPEGTGNYQENPCPVGNYCPEGGLTSAGGRTGYPIPCPPGTYGSQAGSEFSVCQDCPSGLYNNLEGQSACFTCGSSAYSEPGSAQCTCTGFNRAFQASDGSCICKSGFIYYNEIAQIQEEGNSPFSCESIVDERCGSDQVRVSSDRSCVTPTSYSCIGACQSGDGTFNVDLGTCLCDKVTVPEEIPCSSGCYSMTSTLDSTSGLLTLSTTSSTSGTATNVTVPNVYGPTDKVTAPTGTYLVTMSPQGVVGTLPTTPDVAASVVDGTMQQELADNYPVVTSRNKRSVVDDLINSDVVSSYFGRRLLQTVVGNSTTEQPTVTTATTVQLPVISNPVICLQLNEMIIFNLNLNEDNRSLSNYPIYVRNHLFNTNPNFDYGSFRQLQTYITQSNYTVTNFAHIFTESGIYVFADAQNPQQQLILNVLDSSLVCDPSRIQPTTTTSLSLLGVAKQPVSNLTPNWALIGVLLGLFAACVVILVIAVIVWRPRDAGIYPMKYWMPRYRSLGAPYAPPEKQVVAVSQDIRQGLGFIRERGEAEGAEGDVIKDQQVLEDFNVRTLYDKLEDQTLHLKSQLDKHQDSLQGFYEKMSDQTEDLKKMLDQFDASALGSAERVQAAAGDGTTVINTTLQMDGLQQGALLAGSSLREKELLRSLEALINKLNTGKITVSDEVIDDARRRLEGLESEKGLGKGNTKKTGVDDWKAQSQSDLIRAQQVDKIDLDRQLLSSEREALSNLIIAQDDEKQKILSQLDEKLAFRTQGDLSNEEMDALLAEHERELENALGALSRERARQMDDLKEQLAARRRERAEQLSREHAKQCKDAGMPDTSDDVNDDIDAEDYDAIEKQLEGAHQEERGLASQEEAEALRELNSDAGNLSKTLDDELNALVSSGLINDDVREQVRRQILEQEQNLHDRLQKKREMQVKALRDRMADRKQKRLRKLQEKQEKEKSLMDDVTPEMEERHALERDALSAECDAEAASVERDVLKAIQEEFDSSVKTLHRNIIGELSEKHGVDPVTQQELLERYRREADNYDHVNETKRNKQRQNVEAKLAAKRARKAAEIQRSNEEKMRKLKKEEEEKRLHDLEAFQEEQNASGRRDSSISDGLVDVPDVKMTDNAEVQALMRDQERLLVEIDEQQVVDAERLAHGLDKTEKDEQEALERRLNEETEKVLRETKAKHEAEARARTDLSDEQVQQLLAAHQQELEEMEQSLAKQQNRQRAALREKLASRRQRKVAALRTRQEMEKEREEVDQRKELAQVQAKTMKEVEKDAIIEGIEKNGGGASELVIQKVLRKRHAKELRDLEAEFELKKKVLVENALKPIQDEYQTQRETLIQNHDARLKELENEALPVDEMEKKKAELLVSHKAQLKALDKKHKKKCKDLEQSALSEWKLDYSQAKLTLKEKHYQECADLLRELSPSANEQQSAEEREKRAKKLEEVKAKLEQERSEAEKRFAQEKVDLEEEEERRVKEVMKEFEEELEGETEMEKIKAEKTLETLNKRKEKLLKDKRQKIKEELERAAAAGASEEEQRRILDQHEKDVENLTNKMDQERLRMQSKLQERMKKMRKEKIKAKKEELSKESDKTRQKFENSQKAELQKVQEKQIEELQKTSNMMEKEEEDLKRLGEQGLLETKNREKDSQDTSFQADELPLVDPNMTFLPYPAPVTTYAPVSEEEMHRVLSSSPLFQTLQEIRTVLQSEREKGGSGGHELFVGPDTESKDTELVPTPLSSLNMRELVAYKFGTFVLSLLRARRPAHPPVNLLVADKIPARPDLNKNTFRGSFCFDEGNGILYIKRARLHNDSVGRLSLMIVHTMAHIASNDLADDSSMKFIEEFYHCLAALSDDLFFARYKGEGKEFDKGARDLQSRRHIADDVLDVKLPDRDRDATKCFHKKALEERLAKYSHTGVVASIREELGDIEEKMHKAKQNGTLDGIDQKLSALTSTTSSTPQSLRLDTSGALQPDRDDPDVLNATFASLSREADDLHASLAARDPQLDEVTVRNRLSNVQVKLSDVQKRLRKTS